MFGRIISRARALWRFPHTYKHLFVAAAALLSVAGATALFIGQSLYEKDLDAQTAKFLLEQSAGKRIDRNSSCDCFTNLKTECEIVVYKLKLLEKTLGIAITIIDSTLWLGIVLLFLAVACYCSRPLPGLR